MNLENVDKIINEMTISEIEDLIEIIEEMNNND